MNKHLLAAVALAATALPAAGAAPADAASRVAKFTATFEATYTTDWKLPEHQVYLDCYHRDFWSGAGQERWQVRSRGPAKVVAVQHGRSMFLHVGTWETTGADLEVTPMRAGGMHTRSGGHTQRIEPGQCGGTPEVNPTPAGDCGTKLPSYEVGLTLMGRKVHPELSTDRTRSSEDVRFDDCPIALADGLIDGSWPEVPVTLPRTLFGGRRTITLRGRKSWSDQQPTGRGHGVTSTTSNLTWTLKLKRAR